MTDASAGARPRVRRLVGVYNANGTLRGELAYVIGARLGRAHCALCDITHGRIRERDEWRTCRAGLPVPFDTYHLNDQPESVRTLLANRAPVVVAETDQGLFELLGPDTLDACHGSPEALVAALEHAVEHHGIDWPS